MTIGDAVRRAGQLHGDADAIVYVQQPGCAAFRIDFGELDNLTTRIASGLHRAGLPRHARIGVWMPNEPEWIILQWAIAKAGMAIVTLNPLYRERELVHALHLAEVDAIFCLDALRDMRPYELVMGLREKLPRLKAVFSVRTDLQSLAASGDVSVALPAVAPGDLSMIQFTSGTTGNPRAVKLSHEMQIATARSVFSVWRIGAGDRVGHGFPLFHIGGSGIISIGCMLSGAAVLPMRIFDAATMVAMLAEERCTVCLAVPTMFVKMLDILTAEPRQMSLRFLTSGGSIMHEDLRHRVEKAFGAPLLNVYGQTETSGVTTTARSDEPEEVRANRVGRPLPGVTLVVRDAENRDLPAGSPGEIWCKGPGSMLGYIGESPPCTDTDGQRWIASGDRGILHDDGTLSVLGRVKELIIRGGENLSPGEIESVVQEFPGVLEAAAIGVPDSVYGEEVCVFIRCAAGTEVRAQDVRRYCSAQLSRWKVPKFVFQIEAFPLTPSGKIQKFLLRERALELVAVDA
jgi:fatty-acyl-CoA synthase